MATAAAQKPAPSELAKISAALSDPTPDDRQRLNNQKVAWDAYYGRFPAPLKRMPRQPDDCVLVNYCAPVADKGVSFLFGQDLQFEVNADPLNPTAASKVEVQNAQRWLDGFWKANKQMTLLQRLALNGAATGQPMLRLLPGTTGNKRNPYPRLVVVDPQTVNVATRFDDIDAVTAYVINYGQSQNARGMDVQRRQLIAQDSANVWHILDQERIDRQGQSWTVLQSVAWPYAWAPMFETQNLPAPNEHFGLPDLTPDIIQTNKDINFFLSNLARIIRLHAHPQTWGKGFSGDSLKRGPDNTWIIQNKDALLANLEMSAAGSEVTLSVVRELRNVIEAISRVPAIALGDMADMPKSNVSGVALQLLFQPLLEKTQTKRRLYGDVLEAICICVLEMGLFDVEGLQITIRWPNILPADELALAQTMQVWQTLDVSRDTIWQKIGLNADVEAEKLKLQQAATPKPAPSIAAVMPIPGSAQAEAGNTSDGAGDDSANVAA